MAGKFAAAWTFLGLGLILTFPIVFTVYYLGSPDGGVIFASYIGSFLMAGAYLAIGCLVSATTNNQVISFVVSTSICLLLILLGFQPVVDTLLEVLPTNLVDQLTNVSFPYHFEAIQRGVIDLRDIFYFFSFILFGLVAGAIVLERGR